MLSHAALFHDVGKLAVPEAILLKPEKLGDLDWVVVRRHPEEGARLIEHLGFLEDALPAIRHHHERYDGTGYPDKLAGEDIPLGARIIHLADALDAMLTSRPYRPALEPLDSPRAGSAGIGTAVLPALRGRPRPRSCSRSSRRARTCPASCSPAERAGGFNRTHPYLHFFQNALF